MLAIHKTSSGVGVSNSYIAGDGADGIIIDAGARADDIRKMVAKSGMKPAMIVLTHCHFDHIEYVDEIRAEYGIEAAIHAGDADAVADPMRNGSRLFGPPKALSRPGRLLSDGQIIAAGSAEFQILHTPGHTPGGICILSGDGCALFSGDTIFKGAVGRTDLGGGSMGQLLESIWSKIMALDDGVRIYPGHGFPTTVGDERRTNPFLAT
ncbi:MAG: MBL fold metallo-hydrolase [Clostridiales bacterium]|nr:MBL fold metallo-hydrolase [Clostridiales bacterium]